MSREWFDSEREQIASFAPDALISEACGKMLFEVPVMSTDALSRFRFALIYDDRTEAPGFKTRVYPLEPSASDIADALAELGRNPEDVVRLFGRDFAGNPVIDTPEAHTGSEALAYATAYVSLLQQVFDDPERLTTLLSDPGQWRGMLPKLGVACCGRRVPWQGARGRTNAPGPAPAAQAAGTASDLNAFAHAADHL